MLDGTAAGMVTGKQLQEELARKQEADRKRLASLDSSVTGRYAKTVSCRNVNLCRERYNKEQPRR